MNDRLTSVFFFFFNDTATTEIYTLSLHDALPIFGKGFLTISLAIVLSPMLGFMLGMLFMIIVAHMLFRTAPNRVRSEEHTSELQSRLHLVCRLLLEKKKEDNTTTRHYHPHLAPLF